MIVMKRILICIQDFKQGGIPRCLQTLLAHIDTSLYNVDLFCLRHEGDYLGDIPNCRVLPEDYLLKQLMVFSTTITWKNIIYNLPSVVLKTIRKLIKKAMGRDILLARLASLGNHLPSAEYDVAIAYAEGYPSVLIENVKAKKRLLWIHNDYAFQGARQGSTITNYAEYSAICCVSRATKESFDAFFPKYSNKTQVIYNLTNYELIKRLAREPIDDVRFDTNRVFTILSVGRVCAQKNFVAIPSIVNDMRLHGVMGGVKWFIIGDGPEVERACVEQEIKKYGVEDTVILLGNKPNPFSYLSKADLFVLTSVYESYPTVINEAKVLNVPIMANDIPPAHEMLQTDEAIIVDIKGMATKIAELIIHKDEYASMIQQRYDFSESNKALLNQFYVLVE